MRTEFLSTGGGSEGDARREAVSRADALRTEASLHGQLRRFLWLLMALEGPGADILDTTTVRRVVHEATSILRRNVPEESRSQLAFLHDELRDHASRVAFRYGNDVQAAWIAARAQGRDAKPSEVLRAAELQLDLGLASRALQRLVDAEMGSGARGPITALVLTRVRILRLMARRDEARALVDGLAETPDVLWERAILLDCEEGGAAHQARLLRGGRGRDTHLPGRLLRLRLFSHATRKKTWLGVTPKAITLRRRLDKGEDLELARCIQDLERCLDVRTPCPVASLERAASSSGSRPSTTSRPSF